MHLLFDALRAPSKVRSIASFNRLKDYSAISSDARLRQLHLRVSHLLAKAQENWNSYDYGEGYLYQGLAAAAFTGLRDTDSRYREMKLEKWVTGKSVLEIGCNAGFLSILVAETAQHVLALDINPFLIEIGKEVACHFDRRNVDFLTSSFEGFQPDKDFEVVMSFANHSTFDQNTQHDLETYFRRCREMLCEGGLFLFESHAPDFEGDKLNMVIAEIEKHFSICENTTLEYGSFMDTGRRYVVAET